MALATISLRKSLASLPPEKQALFVDSLSPRQRTILSREIERDSLMDFIPAANPALVAPRHLGPLVDVLEHCIEEPCRVVVSTPPQHGKTLVSQNALVWLLAHRNPALRHAYVSYDSNRAEQISLECQQLADNIGLKYTGSRKHWATRQGGGVHATGIGGPLTGYGVNGLLLVDDACKNRAEAESAIYRERTDQWFRDVALTRTHPGASVIVIATRWHPDDLPGRLIARGWQSINLPAINEDGEALWPDARPLSWLQEKRTLVGEYTWSSLYQGRPVARGGAVFGDVHLADKLPVTGYRVAIGIDCAYTAKTHADYSCAVVLVKTPDARAKDGSITLGPIYVADVVRMQVQVPQFAARLNLLRSKYGNPRAVWYTSTTEQGLAQMFVPPVEARLAKADKFVRAQPAAAAWNAGRILVPRGAPWADAFLSEVCSFTGVHDPHDDQVDALAAAYDALMGKQPVVTQAIRTPLSELG